MKERIEKMIEVFDSHYYDSEGEHIDYDKLLEDFIQNYDPELLPLMKQLISMDKEFWYA